MKKIIITLNNGEKIEEEVTEYGFDRTSSTEPEDLRFQWFFKGYGQSYRMLDIKSIVVILNFGKRILNISIN